MPAAPAPVGWLPVGTVLVVVGLLLTGAITGWAVSAVARLAPRSQAVVGPVVARLDLDLPEGQFLDIPGARGLPFDIAPDGSRLVYVAHDGESAGLFVRELNGYQARLLPGTEHAEQPFFSPDGRWVASSRTAPS